MVPSQIVARNAGANSNFVAGLLLDFMADSLKEFAAVAPGRRKTDWRLENATLVHAGAGRIEDLTGHNV
jgi:hypothetical protein